MFYEGMVPTWNQLLKKVLDSCPLMELLSYLLREAVALQQVPQFLAHGQLFDSNIAELSSFLFLLTTPFPLFKPVKWEMIKMV